MHTRIYEILLSRRETDSRRGARINYFAELPGNMPRQKSGWAWARPSRHLAGPAGPGVRIQGFPEMQMFRGANSKNWTSRMVFENLYGLHMKRNAFP